MEKNNLTFKRKILFVFILISIPFIVISLVEFSLRLIHSGNDLSLFQESNHNKGYYEINRSVGKRYFTKLPATYSMNDLFLIEKPDSCYRIFILGGSTAQGFPYQSGVSLGRILNYRLQDAFPNKLIEVVNLAMVATNSYTQADFIDEILLKEPDAILIYAGHNEYYGALGVGSVENGGNVRWIKRLNLKLVHLRTYQLLQRIIFKSFKAFSGDLTDNPTATIMEHIVKEKAIEYGSEMFYDGIEQFKINMEEILSKAQKKKIPVLIGEVVSNVRDIKPFKSVSSVRFPLADSIYSLAQSYDSMFLYKQARELYNKAKDLDGIRFRAPEELNDAIRELGEKYNIPVVPVMSVFESNSPDGIIGNHLMLEHLHPNIDGYFMLADAYFNAIKENGLINEKWNDHLCKPNIYYRSNWGFTALDSLVADLLAKKLMAGWPFQPDTVVNQFRFTYQPVSYIDSMAFMCIKYNDVFLYNQHKEVAKKYEQLGQFNEAFREYFSLIKSNPHESSLYYTSADLLLKANNPVKAISVLKMRPGFASDFNTLVKISQCYRYIEEWNEAISWLQKSIKISQPDDDKETALILLYDTYIKALLDTEAKLVLAELIKINPEHEKLAKENKVKIVMAGQKVKPLLDSAVVFARAGNLTDATVLLNKSIQLEETSFAYSMLGSIFFQTDKEQSIKYYLKAYKLDAKDANVLNNLCVLSIMKKDFDSANKYLDELKKVSDNTTQINGLSSLLQKSQSGE
jgi:tetratricopeptide (TPR) repeat protein